MPFLDDSPVAGAPTFDGTFVANRLSFCGFRLGLARAVRIDARVKVVLLFAYSIALFFIESATGMVGAAALLAVAGLGLEVSWVRVLRLGVPAYPILTFVTVFNIVNAGWVSGLLVGVRLALLVWASLVVYIASTPTELTVALQRFMAPLGRLGLPVRDATTALSIALRFMPVMAEELGKVRAAQAARGARFDQGAPMERLRAASGLMVPLFVGVFRRADRLACAMDARCFGASQRVVSLDARSLSPREVALLLTGIAVCLCLGFVC